MALFPTKNTRNNVSKVKKLFFIFILVICYLLPDYCLANPPAESNYKPEYTFSKDCYKNSKEYKVLKVFDGDTIGIVPIKSDKKTRYEKIRFLGIDAFEHDQKPYGEPAYKYLSMLLLGKNVCIETDIDEHDKYGRTLGYVFLRQGDLEKTLRFRSTGNFMSSKNLSSVTPNYIFANEELVKSGYAILYASEPNVKYKEKLKKGVRYARENMLGVWNKSDYIRETPSEFRHKHPHKKKSKKSIRSSQKQY